MGRAVIINCYHKNIKDSLIAHLTLVGHNDIINDFKILLSREESEQTSFLDKRFFKWTRHFNEQLKNNNNNIANITD